MSNGSELSFTYQDTSYESEAHLAEALLECGPTIDPNGSPNFMSVAYFRVGAAGRPQLAAAGITPLIVTQQVIYYLSSQQVQEQVKLMQLHYH